MEKRNKLRLQLSRGLTYNSPPYFFKRGTPLEIAHPDGTPDEGRYHALLRSGYVSDPDQRIDIINPLQLKKVPAETEVIVMRDMGLGDVMMASLGIRQLAADWPLLKISYAISSIYIPLFRDCNFLHRVLSIVDMTGIFPCAIDLRGYSERADDKFIRNRIDLFADYLRVRIQDYKFCYRVKPEEAKEARKILQKDDSKTYVGIAIRGSTRVRTWPYQHVESFCQMAARRGWIPVLFDHQRFGMNVAGVINLTNQLSITQLAAVINECDLVVTPDTGTKELAEAVETPHINIFSTIDPALRLNHYKYSNVIWRGFETTNGSAKVLECCPCWDKGCDDLPCLWGVSPEVVIAKAEEVLESAESVEEAV